MALKWDNFTIPLLGIKKMSLEFRALHTLLKSPWKSGEIINSSQWSSDEKLGSDVTSLFGDRSNLRTPLSFRTFHALGP